MTEVFLAPNEKASYNINRKYKDSLFCMLFGQEENKPDLLELYNALNDTSYTDPSELELYTMSDVIYMRMKNDVACMLHDTMSLIEHQSTINPNMPLRGLMYFSRMYERYRDTNGLNVYSSTLQKLPTPQYYVLYNGETKAPDRSVLRLSDAFIKPVEAGMFEWTAIMLNINAGHNKKILSACSKLNQYSQFVSKVRECGEEPELPAVAVDRAVDWCIENRILADFLQKHRAEVKDMFLTEYDEQETMRLFREEYKAEGRTEGQGHLISLLIAKGKSEDEIANLFDMTVEEVSSLAGIYHASF